MAAINLGKLVYLWRGDYSAGAAYAAYDVCRYQNKVYICTEDAAAGENPASVPVKWDLMTEGIPATADVGTDGQVLTSNGPNLAPSFQATAAIISENTTISVAASGGDFTTLRDALDSLDGTRIAAGVTVTISLAAEVFTETASIVINHPDGAQILISGPTPLNTAITGQHGVSGSAGAYSCILNVTNASIFETDKYCLIGRATGSSGEGHAVYNGCWEVTDVDAANNRITIANTARNATFPGGNVNGGTVKALNTVIDFSTAATHGFAFGNYGYLWIRNVALISTSTSKDCFRVDGSSAGTQHLDADLDVGVNGWRHALNMSGNFAQCASLTVSNTFSHGVYVTRGGWVNAQNLIVTGCGDRGANLANDSHLQADLCCIAGNIGYGVFVSWGSTFHTYHGVIVHNLSIGLYLQGNSTSRFEGEFARISGNGSHGVYVTRGAMFYLSVQARVENNGSYGVLCTQNATTHLTSSVTVNGNASTDLRAISHGFIRAVGGATYTTTSPAVNTTSNEGAYISTYTDT